MAYRMVGLSVERDAIPQQLKMSMEHTQDLVRTESCEGLQMALHQSKHITTPRLNSAVLTEKEGLVSSYRDILISSMRLTNMLGGMTRVNQISEKEKVLRKGCLGL